MYALRLLLITCLLLTACTSPTLPPEISYSEVVGDQSRRVEIVTAMLTNFHALPTPIIDAQFVEEKIGNDELGPADYRAFTLVQVAPENLTAWQAILTPLDNAPNYNAPSQVYDWWVEESAFSTLTFYAPDTLSGRANGWIAVDPQSAMIYIFSFTT